jgi:isoamylase
VEGPTDDPQINALRAQQQRNFLATLLLSQGVPMILGGDERGRTQQGNNNAYCQDNEISWVDWYLDDAGRNLLDFTRKLVQIRKAHPVLRRRKFLQGRRIYGTDIRDIVWLRPDNGEMTEDQWHNDFVRCLGMLLNGQAMTEWSVRGQRVYDDVLLVLFNAHDDEIPFYLPAVLPENHWDVLVDTAEPTATPGMYEPDTTYPLQGRSLALLIQHSNAAHDEDETYADL